MDFQGFRGDRSSHPRPRENVLRQRTLRQTPFLVSFLHSLSAYSLPQVLPPSFLPTFHFLSLPPILLPLNFLSHLTPSPHFLSLIVPCFLPSYHPSSTHSVNHTLSLPLLTSFSFSLPGITLEGSCQGVYRSASFSSILIFKSQYFKTLLYTCFSFST